MARILTVSALGLLLAVNLHAGANDPSWNARGAAAYLDAELQWWATWPQAARDRGTFCVSCHTVAPYALARPALARTLGETGPSPAARELFANVSKRVGLWNEVAPYYPDQTRGIPKTSESRGTEAVLNALVLASRDAAAGAMADDTRAAFANMWALQMRTGDLNGAWAWLNFHLEPWESDGGPFFGAAMAVAALGRAPGGYASSAEAGPHVNGLRAYVSKSFDGQNLFNRLTMIAAASRMEGIVTHAQRTKVADAVAARQQTDGGWSLSAFGDFKRGDDTPLVATSDGYATALAVIALGEAPGTAPHPALARGAEWLRKNQDTATGKWRATSLNKHRDPASDPARFMNDAATAYAALALAGQ
jgi:hypothetical protein